MQMKKVVSLIMVVAMMLTMAVIPASFSAQEVDNAETALNTTSDYALAPNIQSGNILHAFNWRMRDLVKYAPEIAAAGYSSVQISPIQATKVTANDGSYATDWWSFYQPTDMKIGNALGTADELKAATTELHKYGIKVVADVVTNHVQNCTSKAESKLVADALQYSSNGSTAARHNLLTHPSVTSDSDRKAMVQGDLGGQLPDMNTGNKTYQNYVIDNLLNPLADNGVDGFRFDAAKHIETPDDGAVASDYWPTVTNAIRAKNSNAFIYGEVLSNAGKFNITSYTKYMNVTDYNFGNVVRASLNSKNASSLTSYGYSGSQKNQNVLWVESHDTFCDKTSTDLTKKQQILGWAVVGSRADAPALFFVRPKHEALDSAGFIKYDELMGAPGAADTWKDPTVVAVNKFKNAMVGKAETTTASGANLFVQRGTEGMVIVNLNGSSTSISQSCSMANGTYTDQVTGGTFTVSGGKISGNVGASGVAVVYNATASNSAPTIKLELNGTELNTESLDRYTGATADIKVTLGNSTGGSIKVSNLSAKSVNNGVTEFKLNSSIPYGKSIDITVTAQNGSKTVSRTYNIKKKNASETKRVYFDNSAMKWPAVYVFCKTGTAPSTAIAKYDAYQMKAVSGSSTLLYYDVPANTNYVKFNEGFIGSQYTDKSHVDAYGRCHLFHTFSECGGYCGRTMPETVVNYGTANSAANRENGGYKLDGAMILSDLRFEDYGDYPVATLSAADTTLDGGEAPTQPATQPETQAPTQPATDPKPGKKLLLGDADLDGDVNIMDVTFIQRYVIKALTLSEDAQLCSDVDGNGDVEAVDATFVQRFTVHAGTPYKIGEWFYVEGGEDPTQPATQPQPETQPVTQYQPETQPATQYEPETQPETQAPTQSQELVKLPNKFVAVIYCEEFGTDDASRNKEAAFDEYGRLTFDFPAASYVFVRNYDTGIQYCTDGWSDFAHPVTLVNQNDLTGTFDKMYIPAGEHTLVLQPGEGDTYVLDYDTGATPVIPTSYIETQPETQGGGDTVTLYFSNNKFWDGVNVYMWKDGGGESTAWPGVSANHVCDNDFGEGIYSVTVDTSVYDHVIFNGSGGQTADVDVAEAAGQGCGIYCLDDKNDEGHYLVGFYEYAGPYGDETTAPTSYQPETQSYTQGGGDTVTLYFSNNKSWDGVNVYMWMNGGGESTAWPGVSADYVGNNTFGEGIYSVTVDTSVYDHVIFNGSGGQTADVDVAEAAGQGCGIYCLDTKNDEGHYLVGFYEYAGPYGGETETTTPTSAPETQGGNDGQISFLLTDNFGWGTAYVYAWDANGTALVGEWPGAAQAETITNGYGETQFRCYVPEGAVGVILNNGNGAQTEDITDFGTYDGYWMDGTKNDKGHYIVTGWNAE